MPAVDSLRIDLPTQWTSVPTQADEVDAFLRESEIAENWARLEPTDRRRIENIVRRLGNEMQIQQCAIAAVYAEIVMEADPESAQGEERPTVLSAVMTASVVNRTQIGTALSLSPDLLLAAASARTDTPKTYRELEPPTLVDLNVGRVVQCRRLQRIDDAGDEMFVELYMIPVEPEHEHVVMLQFATPTLEMSGEFSDLFGVMANTFALYREGEPTPA